jgi:archaellin
MKALNDDDNNTKLPILHNIYLATAAATIFTLAIILASTTTPESASATGNTTTTTATSSSGLELSSQPIWDEQATSTSVTPLNETHRVATFIGNGTMTVPDTGETINMTNNGTAFISPVPGYAETVSAYGREYVFSEDDNDSTAITFYEIIRYDSATF